MHAVVTGGAGFIGSHLSTHLLQQGAHVTILDDLSTGDRANLTHLDGLPLEILEGDVRDVRMVARALAGAELVFHLAAGVGPELVAEDPVGTWSRNVEGARVVLDEARAAGCRVVLASSSEVYGPYADLPMSEDDPVSFVPSERREVYALSKLAAEGYAMALHRSALLPVTIVRFFNIVGPRQSARHGMVLARFAEAARRGKALPVYGDGSQRRCFLDVRDACNYLIALAHTPRAEGLVVNLGSDDDVSVLELADKVNRLAGNTRGIEFIPYERVHGEGFRDPLVRRPDLRRLRTLTDLTPAYTLDETIRDALAAAPA